MVLQIHLEMVSRAEFHAGVFILNWDEQLPSNFPKLWMALHETMIVLKSSN